MGKELAPQVPRPMPSREKVAEATQGLAKPFLVCGCRGPSKAENTAPKTGIHDQVQFVTGTAQDLAGKRVMVFSHGYNLPTQDALNSARDLFAKLHDALVREQADTTAIEYVLFTWPGDTGALCFNEAQAFAQISGIALYKLLSSAGARSISVITHSLGAHVALRAASMLGERLYHDKAASRIDSLLLLGASVEDDVFERPGRTEEYHFPDAAFGARRLHISASRDDAVLGGLFRINEADGALGYCGPESMDPLVSLARRVREVTQGQEDFHFELHDFSANSPTIWNPELRVCSHSDYWKSPAQLNYYVNFLAWR